MPSRTSPRHPDFDYRTPAAYFVTVCAHDRRCLFGTVRRGRMRLNDVGLIVSEEWRRSETMREEVILDAFVVMPNHLHGIICLVPLDVDDVSPRGYDLTVGPSPLSNEKITDDDVGTHDDAHESAPNDDVGTTGGRVKRGHAASVRVVPTCTGGSKTRGPALPIVVGCPGRIQIRRDQTHQPASRHAGRPRLAVPVLRSNPPQRARMAGLPAVRRAKPGAVVPRPESSRPAL